MEKTAIHFDNIEAPGFRSIIVPYVTPCCRAESA